MFGSARLSDGRAGFNRRDGAGGASSGGIPSAGAANGAVLWLMPVSLCFAVSRREKMKAGCSIVDKPEGGGGKGG